MKILERLSARNSSAGTQRPIVIVGLGDSVTHGCFDLIVDSNGDYIPHYMPEQGYVSKIGVRLNKLFPGAAVTMLNAGVSGDSSKGGLARLERDVLSFSPDLVLVNFGLNDSMNPEIESGIKAYEQNMTDIFTRILASGAEAILVTPNFMCSYIPTLVVGEKLRSVAEKAAAVQKEGVLAKYVDAARSAANRLGVPIADAYSLWENMHAAGVDTTALLSNGINHPTVEMHEIFVDEVMRRMFEKK